MSIFGHLAAPVNGLCLITLCLLSAGLADGYNSFLSPQLPLIYVEPVHTDATGQLVSDLYFVQLDAPTTATLINSALWQRHYYYSSLR